ncbi:MAG: SH3 domain-containing protein [Prevotella sp.]|jgi:hypothetical protein|nr:SH3 domain-containing protein [Prevotella sp.]
MKHLLTTLLMLLAATFTAQASDIAPEGDEMQQQTYVVVNGTNVRLRFEPNLTCSFLCYDNGSPRYAPKGTRLPYLGEKGDFYYVQYDKYKVYISKQYSYIENNKAEKFYVVINGTNVRLRTGPGTNYSYFTWNDGSPCYLPKGTYLGYLGEQNDFYKADYKGHTVYVSKKFSYITK